MAPTFPFGDPQQIVGRERERAQLRHLLDSAISGNGRLVLVSGEAGIGKTTLIEAAAREAAERGMLVLSGGCYDLTATPPYGPWVEILRAYPAAASLPAIPDALRERGGLEQIGSQEQLFRIVGDFLTDVAAATSLALILEDLQWSDVASLELLRYVARQISRQRIVMLVSYRDDELTRTHPLFAALPLIIREARAERLDLQPFDDELMRAFIANQYPLSSDDIQALGAYLHQHTEGNPLFAGELLRSLERERVLSESDGDWRLGALNDIVPPTLVVQMIERHLTALDPAARDALEVAAVLGQEIVPSLWGKVTELDDEELSKVSEQAFVARLIEPYGKTGLRFRHALIREVLYQGTLFPRRRVVHRQTAESLIEDGTPDPDVVASHFQRAGDERALQWLIEAGHQASRAFATFTAADRYGEALRLLEHDKTRLNEQGWLLLRIAMVGRERAVPRSLDAARSAQRIGNETGDDPLAAWSLYMLGITRVFAGENGLFEMQQGLKDLRSLPQSAFERIPEHFQQLARNWRVGLPYLDASIAIVQSIFGRYRDALVTTERLFETVPPPAPDSAGEDWNEWGHAQWACTSAFSALGDPEEANLAYRRCQEAYRKRGNTGYAALSATGMLQYIALVYEADQLTRRQRLAAEVESLWTEASGLTIQLPPRFGLLPLLVVEGAWTEAREIAEPFANRGLVFHDIALLALGLLDHAQGRRENAWDRVRTAIPSGPDTEPGTRSPLSTLELYRLAATMAMDDEDLALARCWIEAHDRWLEWSERIQGRAEAQLLWARYHRIAGGVQRALRHAGMALEHASDPRQPLALVSALRMLGELELAEQQYDGAEGHLRHSLTLAEACAAPYEQALTLLPLAELDAATGNPDDAWAQLNRVRAICAPLGATPALERATSVAAKLAVRRGQPVHPAGLSPREVEVLQLVADGLTNAEVAEQLFISPRTVGQHLRSVYNKLGVNSRVDATRFAVEQGLTGSSSR